MKALIERKLEEIRGEPEHVRLRYVWGLVAVVMVLVFSFWVMTLRDNLRSSDTDADIQTLKDSLPSSAKDLQSDSQSVKQIIDEAQSLSNEGVTAAGKK